MATFTQWLMGIIAVVLGAVGAALCFAFTGGLGLIVGSALLAGGVSGFMAAYQGLSWGDFWTSVVSGAICGALSGFASPLISNVATHFASLMGNQLSGYLIHMAVSVVGHMALSFVTNGLQNVFRGKSFTANWKQALLSGAVIGAISSAVYIIQDYGIDKIVQKIEKFYEEYGSHPLVSQFTNRVRQFIPDYISRMNDGFLKQGLQFAWEKVQSMSSSQLAMFINNNIHYIGEFVVGAASQYIMHGKVNFLLAAGQAIAYGCANRSLASRNLSRQLMRQVPPPAVLYNTNSIIDTVSSTLRSGTNEVEQPATPNQTPEAQIPASKEPLSTPAPIEEPPTYEEATRDDVLILPSAEPSVPSEAASISPIGVGEIATHDDCLNFPETPSYTSLPEVSTDTNSERIEPSAPLIDSTVSPPLNVSDEPSILQPPQISHVHKTDVPVPQKPENNENKNQTNVSKTLTLKELGSEHATSKATAEITSIVTENNESILQDNVIEPLSSSSITVLKPLKTEPVAGTIITDKVEEFGTINVIDSKNEKKGGNDVKIASEYVAFNKGSLSEVEEVPVHHVNVSEAQQCIKILSKSQNELVSSDEEFEIINDYERYDVDTIDGNAMENIETELFKVNKIYQEQEQNQIKESCQNSRLEVWQYNTEDYAQKIGVNVQNHKNEGNIGKPKKFSILETLKLTKNNIVPNISDFCKPLKWTASSRSQKKLLFVSPFVLFNEKEAKYQLWDPKEWPVFPEGGVRVVTVSGSHSSGRTTFIHSLAYTLGYSLTEEQAITSRFPTGVFMYLFSEDNLLVLDCTDSLTRIDDNLAPSALTLELFCNLISDHRIHHVVMGDNPGAYIDHCEKTMKMLYRSGGFVDLQGGRMATLLLRYPDKMSKKGIKKFNEMQSNYQKQTEEKVESYRNLINVLNDPSNFIDSNGDEIPGLKGEKENEFAKIVEDRSFDLKMEKLIFLPKNYSTAEQQLYHSEVRHIAEMIIKTTPIHHAFEELPSEIENQRPSFCELASELWYRIAESDELFKSTTNAMNKHTVSQSGDKFNVDAYFKEIQEQFGNVDAVVKTFQWIKEASEENAKNDEKDAMFVFRGIARIAEAVLKDRNNGNVNYYESCVHYALRGLLLFFGEGQKTFELMSVKAAIEDTKVLEELIDDEIINNFATVWAYFHHVAYYLFRLELINIEIVAKAINVLQKKGNGTEDQKIKANIYATMSMLIYADVNCILGQKAPSTENKKLVDEENFAEIHFKFEKEADKFLIPFKEGREYKTRQEFHEAYGRMMNFPETYFNGTDYAKYKEVKFDDLDPPVKYRFHCTMLKHFYNAIGYYVSKNVIENYAKFMPSAFDDIDEAILSQNIINLQRQALSLWSCIANLSVTFENLLPKMLLKTDLKEWLLTYRKNLQQTNLVAVLHLCNVIIYSESIYDYIQHPEFDKITANNQDFNEILVQNKRKALAKYYRHIVFDILEKTKITKAIKTFCDKNFDSSMLEEAETWIMHFEVILKQGLGKDDKNQCLFAFLDRRFGIIKKLCTVARLAEITLNDEESLSSPDTITKTLKLLFATAQFLNKLMVLNQVEENGDFFNIGKKKNSVDCVLPVNSEVWGDLTKIFEIFAETIVKQGRYFLEKTTLDSNIYEHGVLYVLWYIYNLSSISKISYSFLKAFLPSNSDSFDHLRLQFEEKLIYKIEDFCAIEVYNNEKKDIQIIQTGAYIWAKYSTKETQNLRETFHEEFNCLFGAFDESVKIWRCSEKRNKQIEDFKKRLIAGVENSEVLSRFAEQLLAQPAQSYQIDDTMRYMEIANGKKAITENEIIFSAHGHDAFYGWQFVAPNLEQKLFKALIMNCGKPKALALMFILGNDKIDKIQFVTKHFEKLLKMPPKDDMAPILSLRTKSNGVLNAKVQDLFKQSFIFEVFTEFGYQKEESEDDGIKCRATVSSILEKRSEIEIFLNVAAELIKNNKIGDLMFKSVFSDVTELATNESDRIGSFEYLELPTVFVKNAPENIRSWTVKTLREIRMRDNIRLQYSLIRIILEDGKTVQAVFLAGAFLNSVFTALAQYLNLKDENQIRLSNVENMNLSADQSLESLGLVPGGYLKAIIVKL
uniref:Uncharacterized protein n=1 Tax=Panagrolaimus sp. PS1159 TaxID=55785 RepID=A0AC35GLJ8_9BILA